MVHFILVISFCQHNSDEKKNLFFVFDSHMWLFSLCLNKKLKSLKQKHVVHHHIFLHIEWLSLHFPLIQQGAINSSPCRPAFFVLHLWHLLTTLQWEVLLDKHQSHSATLILLNDLSWELSYKAGCLFLFIVAKKLTVWTQKIAHYHSSLWWPVMHLIISNKQRCSCRLNVNWAHRS